MKETYWELTDEELILRLRAGERDIMDFLLEKYKALVRKKANAMFLMGGDQDDLNQEGMIGLYKAIRDYDAMKETRFSTFAGLCISRQMYTAIEQSKRKKNVPLNSYVSLDSFEDMETLFQISFLQENNPESIYIDHENFEATWNEIVQTLSAYEKKVLQYYLNGMSSADIAEKLQKKQKSVDNAIQRIRTKILQKQH